MTGEINSIRCDLAINIIITTTTQNKNIKKVTHYNYNNNDLTKTHISIN